MDGLLVNAFDRSEVSSMDPRWWEGQRAGGGLVLAPWTGVYRDHLNAMTLNRLKGSSQLPESSS